MRCSRWIAITQCSRTDRVLVWNPQSGTEPHRAQVLWGTDFPGSAAPAVPEPSNLHLLVAGLARFRSPPSLSKANAMLASLFTLVAATALLPASIVLWHLLRSATILGVA